MQKSPTTQFKPPLKLQHEVTEDVIALDTTDEGVEVVGISLIQSPKHLDSQFPSLISQFNLPPQLTPPSKLQQEGVSDGVVLGTGVGVGVGLFFAIHFPGKQLDSQLASFILQNSPPPQLAPLSKLQQEGVTDGAVLNAIVGEAVGVIFNTHFPGKQPAIQFFLLTLQ